MLNTCKYYLEFPLLGFVDHLGAVTQDAAVKNPEVLNVVFDNVVHLRFIFSNYHPEVPLSSPEKK